MRPKRLHHGIMSGIDELDELIRVTGAEVIDYFGKERCCGGPLRGTSEMHDDLSRELIRQKLFAMKEAGAQCVVTVCPLCFLQLDSGQLDIKRSFKEEYNIPVLHFAELLRLAMGMELSDWEIKSHRIPLKSILENWR